MSKNKNSLTRIPQAFSFDTDILSRAYDCQAPLIRDVLVFLANKTTSNFFNDVSFSLDEFCKAFGYNYQQKLLRIILHSYQFFHNSTYSFFVCAFCFESL